MRRSLAGGGTAVRSSCLPGSERPRESTTIAAHPRVYLPSAGPAPRSGPGRRCTTLRVNRWRSLVSAMTCAGPGPLGPRTTPPIVIVDGDRRLGACTGASNAARPIAATVLKKSFRSISDSSVSPGASDRLLGVIHGAVRAADCHAIGRQSMDIRRIRSRIPASAAVRRGSQGWPRSERNSTAIPPRSSLRHIASLHGRASGPSRRGRRRRSPPAFRRENRHGESRFRRARRPPEVAGDRSWISRSRAASRRAASAFA